MLRSSFFAICWLNLCFAEQPLTITTGSPLPAGTAGQPYSITLMAIGGAPPYTWGVVSGLPPGLVLNGISGVLSGSTVSGDTVIRVRVIDSSSTTATKDLALKIVIPLSLSGSLPNGVLGSTYSQKLNLTGASGMTAFTLLTGTIPAGLMLALATGVISGTPTSPGIFQFTVRAADSTGAATNQLITISIALPVLFPQATVGLPFSQEVAVSGVPGTGPFVLLSGTLPPGLSMNQTGVISGTPATAGIFQFTVGAADSTGVTKGFVYNVSVTVIGGPPPPTKLPAGAIGYDYSSVIGTVRVSSSTSPTPTTFPMPILAGTLPSGLSISGSLADTIFQRFPPPGIVTKIWTLSLIGKPLQAGLFAFKLNGSDFTVDIGPALTLAPFLNTGALGQNFSQRLAFGGIAPYSIVVNSGVLPAGLLIDNAGGVLSGVPSKAGIFTFSVEARGAIQGYRLQISPSAPRREDVTNAASYVYGSVAPGEILTVFSSGFGPSQLMTYTLDAAGRIGTQLAETQILFDGVPAPLLYVSATQLSAIAPYELDGKSKTQIQVQHKEFLSASFEVPVSAVAPGLFTVSGTGKGQAAALNQNSSANSPTNPADKGSILVLFATGEGQTDPGGMNGQ